MAKAESLTMIERHVEKLVLAVCLVALLLASWQWLFSSPTKLPIFSPSEGKTNPVSPMKADAMLLAAADNVQKMYSGGRATITIPPVPAWVGRLKDLRDMSPLPTAQTDMAEPRIPVGPIEPPTPPTKITLEQLIAAMPVPAKPVVTASIELPKRTPSADVVLARGTSSYPLVALTGAWKPLLKTVTFESVVPYKVIVEVQQAPADGDWSKAEAALVQTVSLDANGKQIAPPEIPDFDVKNVAEVRKARDTVARDAVQQQILQPLYLPVWSADQKQWLQPAKSVQATQPAGQDQAAISFLDDKTMTIGSSCRYRVQLVVVNPLLTYEDAMATDSQTEARQKFLTSNPSQWSDPVSVRREVHFFITGANPNAGKMVVTVYARRWGQWVSKSFEVQMGDSMGGVEKVDLIDPMATGRTKKSVEVDFSTGCVAVRLDFKKIMSRRGFSYKTYEMLYVASEGGLQSRLKVWDDSDEYHKELQDAVRKAASE